MSVVFHVKLLNILGFVHLPEKVLDKYIIMHFEIKGVLSLILCSMFFGGWNFSQIFKLLNSITKGERKLHSVPQH
jgi:hypothetical protein